MDGILLAELEKYVDAQYGDASWSALLDEAGLPPKEYQPDTAYPDAELVAIIAAVPAITPVPLSVLAEDFGRSIAPEILRRYAKLLEPEWRTIELLEHAESIYAAVGASLFGTAASVFRVAHTAPTEVTLTYASSRRLCALAKGFIGGVGTHFGERIEVRESACMLRGAEACTILARRVT